MVLMTPIKLARLESFFLVCLVLCAGIWVLW